MVLLANLKNVDRRKLKQQMKNVKERLLWARIINITESNNLIKIASIGILETVDVHVTKKKCNGSEKRKYSLWKKEYRQH